MRLASLAIIVPLVAAAFFIGRMTAPSAAIAGLPMATTFSHFECYQAGFQGGSFNATVQLKDQFQTYKTGVSTPSLFCTPVAKTVIQGPNMKVPPPANHLTCYSIKGPTIQQTRAYANQFQQGEATVGTPALLCVPTHKTG